MNRTEVSEMDPFESHVACAWPPEKWTDVSVLAAVSGGADSVALVTSLAAIRRSLAGQTGKSRFEVAHFNHGWRDTESDEDEGFVRELCEQLQVTFHIGRSAGSRRTENDARKERYAFLLSVAEERGARYLVTAHTADDQAETILHRILRGTALRGLRGIQMSRKLSAAVTVTRPLLTTTRREVIEYLERTKQSHRTDASNQDLKYTRNRIRLELLPQLAQDYNPAVVDSILRLGHIAKEVVDEIQPIVKDNAESCCISVSPNVVKLDVDSLARHSSFMQREILIFLWRDQGWPEQTMNFDEWNRMVAVIRDRATACFSGGIQLRFEGDTILLVGQES